VSEDRITPASRYAATERTEFTFADGTRVPCLKRRFVPRAVGSVLAEHRVVEGDRPDLIAARFFGDAEQSWRLADANGVLHPQELVEPAGGVVKVALPGGAGPASGAGGGGSRGA
jgi:hypothetical protein